MSRSYHQTLKSVFGGKSKAEIQRMIEDEDPDFIAWVEKRNHKERVKNTRQLVAFAKEIGEDLPEELRNSLE